MELRKSVNVIIGKKEQIITMASVLIFISVSIAVLIPTVPTTEGDDNPNYYDDNENGVRYIPINNDKTVSVGLIPDYENDYPTEITILSEVMINNSSYEVTSIRDIGFINFTELISIVIPDSVVKIGSNAFYGCTSLESISGEIQIVGDNAFYGCTGLISVELNHVTEIGSGVFSNCSGLISVELDSVTVLNSNVFTGATALETLKLNSLIAVDEDQFKDSKLKTVELSSVETIGDNAFRDSVYLESIILGPTEIGSGVFYGCVNLTYVDMTNVISLGDFAFRSSGLSGTIILPASLVYVGTGVFLGTQLDSIEVDDSNEHFVSIEGVLYDPELKELVSYPGAKKGVLEIPSGIVSIRAYAISETAVTSIFISSSVEIIGEYALQFSYGLIEINVDGDNEFFSSVDGVLFDKEGKTLLIFPAGISGQYVIPDGVVVIAEDAFLGSKISSLILSSSIEEVGNALVIAEDLEFVVIPEGNLTVDDIDFPEDLVLIFFSGEHITSVSVSLDGTIVSFEAYTESGYGVWSIKVGTEYDGDDISYDTDSSSFDVGDNKIVYVTVLSLPEYTISFNVSNGGSYEYSINGEDWYSVQDWKIVLLEGTEVQIRATANSGYDFSSWDVVPDGSVVVDGILIFKVEDNCIISGTFTPIEPVSDGEVGGLGGSESDDPGSTPSSLATPAAIIGSMSIIALAGYLVLRRL